MFANTMFAKMMKEHVLLLVSKIIAFLTTDQ